MPCRIGSIDHLVLTVRDIDAAVRFYVEVMGMTETRLGDRVAVKFGSQKINFHVAGQEFDPHAKFPTPGSADLCFRSDVSLEEWETHLKVQGISIEVGPTPRTGATGKLMSIYIRDPNQNLIEISNIIV